MWKSLSKRTIHHHSIFSYEIQLLLSLELLPPHSSISCHKLKREDSVLQHINISNGKIRKQGDKNNEKKLSSRRLNRAKTVSWNSQPCSFDSHVALILTLVTNFTLYGYIASTTGSFTLNTSARSAVTGATG